MKSSSTPISVSSRLRATPLFQGCDGQDGAIHGDFLFRFHADGSCTVYSLKEQRRIDHFQPDRTDLLRPHCNTVCFGPEKYSADDEFPLLYCNIYNNYAKEANRLEGVCCVYRLTRGGNGFSAALVQVLRSGFVENRALWKSLPDQGDIRPYGNFVPDAAGRLLHVYVLRDAEHVTRFFTFALPALSDGEYSDQYGVNVVTLSDRDILSTFDCDYTDYIQGGCCYDGKLFNIAGGNYNSTVFCHPPRMQIVDMKERRQLAFIELADFGLLVEPEMIDFDGDRIVYMDGSGMVYEIDFL